MQTDVFLFLVVGLIVLFYGFYYIGEMIHIGHALAMILL